TNAHLVVAEAPARRADPAVSEDRPRVLTLSARSPGALAVLADGYAASIGAAPDRPLADVAFSANTGRAHLEHRLAVVAGDIAGATTALEAHVAGLGPSDVITGHAGGGEPTAAFLFSGHGSHYPGMGRQLYAAHPAFRDAIDRCAELLRDDLDVALTQ